MNINAVGLEKSNLFDDTWINHDRSVSAPQKESTEMKYRVTITQDEDGVFVVEVPALPGCISQGRIRSEALKNISEAIQAYLESLKKRGEPVPPPITEEIVEV